MGRTLVESFCNQPTRRGLIFPKVKLVLVLSEKNYMRLRSIPVFYILSQSKESQTTRTWPFCSYLWPWLLQAEWMQRCCCRLCGQLKRGGGDPSQALWGHLWNRLTNVSLLCHKDTRLTKLPINVLFTTHLFVTQVFIPAVSRTVLRRLTRP